MEVLIAIVKIRYLDCHNLSGTFSEGIERPDRRRYGARRGLTRKAPGEFDREILVAAHENGRDLCVQTTDPCPDPRRNRPRSRRHRSRIGDYVDRSALAELPSHCRSRIVIEPMLSAQVVAHADLSARLIENFVKRRRHYDEVVILEMRAMPVALSARVRVRRVQAATADSIRTGVQSFWALLSVRARISAYRRVYPPTFGAIPRFGVFAFSLVIRGFSRFC